MTLASVLLALGLGLSWGADSAPVQPPAPPQEQTFGVPLFTEGLHTHYPANSIPDNALTEALNVLIDEDVDGVVVRRPGYAKCNATAIAGAQTARGLWQFDASDGTKYHVAVSSWSFYEHDGDCVWTVIPGLGGAGSEDLEWDCVQALGKLWCTNGSKGIYWDGTSTKTVTGMPAGTLIDTFRNRLLVANVSGNQSRLYLSGELDGEDFTVPSSPVSTSPAIIAIGGVNDGLSITCLMGAYQDTYIIGKRDSLSALYGFDRRNFAVREVSREVGCIEDRTVKEKQNSLYWISKRGVERMRGTVIDRVSDPVRNLVDTIIATAGNLRTVTDTTQGDFEAGNLTAAGPGAPMSATVTPGSVVSSTFSRSFSLDYSWGMVDVDTTTGLSGFIDNFDNANFASGGLTWTVLSGAEQLIEDSTSLRVFKTTSSENHLLPRALSAVTASTGIWSFTFLSTATNSASFTVYLVASTTDPVTMDYDGYAISVGPINNGVSITGAISYSTAPSMNMRDEPITGLAYNSSHTVVFTRASNGTVAVFVNGGLEFNFRDERSITNAGTGLISSSLNTSTPTHLSAFRTPRFYDNLISLTYDTAMTTPTWGLYAVSVTSSSESSVTFKTQVSPTGSGSWTTLTAQTPNTKIASAARRYIRHQARVEAPTTVGLSSPTVREASLMAGTTGQFISQCHNPGTSITSWGRLSCGEVPYNGSFSLAVSTAISCHAATRSTATWNTQIDGSVIAINTAPYVAYRVTFGDFSVFYATANPALQDCTIEWNEGETRPPAAASVYRDRYHLAYTSSTASGAKNDHQLVLDSNDKWVLWDNLNCYSLGIYERKLYCGASTDSGQVWLMDSGTADDGASFTSRFKTKAYSFGRPDIFKEFREFGAELEPEPDSSYSISTNWRYYIDRGTTSYSIGPVDLGEDSGYLLWGRMPFGTGEAVRGRYLQLEGEVSGTNSPFRFYGGLLKWRPLRQD